MSLILGLHLGHDAGVTLLRDGVPVICLAEERLIRQKMYYGFPFLSLEAVMHASRISPDEVDILALDTLELPRIIGPEEMQRRFIRGNTRDVAHTVNKARHLLNYFLGKRGIDDVADKEAEARQILYKNLKHLGFSDDRIRIYDHHRCHAASAFWLSPFPKAMFVTSDGRGDGLSATLGFAEGPRLDRYLSISDSDSIGQFYAAITFYLGFRPNRHEGKITGLAAHGDPKRFGELFLRNVKWNKDGSYQFRIPEEFRLHSQNDLDSFFKRVPMTLKDRVVIHTQNDLNTLMYASNWYSLLAYLESIAPPEEREDLAAGAQYLAEMVCAEFISRNLPANQTPVVLAGGVFSNVRVNQKVRELPGITNVYVQPAMGDDGLSLGSALLAYADCDAEAERQLCQDLRPTCVGHTYLGLEYDEKEIVSACADESVQPVRLEDMPKQVGKWIYEGWVVGFFHGRMEFGPRALGHRSILVRPIDAKVNQELNKRFNRTEFMPFAPSMLAETAGDYLINYQPDQIAAEYMTMTYHIVEERRKEIEAVVHVDGTARPQVVFEQKQPAYHRVISEYYKLSGIPVIINTSFNMHEEPIVCSPRDAIRSMKINCVDVLVMENYALWPDGIQRS
jgi:carbamoyltransferase